MTKRSTNEKRHYRLSLVLDIVVITVSLLAAWLIRSRFSFFMYDLRKFSVLFPWILISRILFNYLFELYSFSSLTLNYRDFARILRNNLPASSILLFLRLALSIKVLSMPLSMIFMEYIFCSFGFLMVRMFLHRLELRKGNIYLGHITRILFWGEVRDIEDFIGDLHLFEEKYQVKIKGILNTNPYFWDSEYKRIRIFGDESQLAAIVAADNTISSVCIVNPQFITKKRIISLDEKCTALNLAFSIFREDKIEIVDIDTLIKISSNQ